MTTIDLAKEAITNIDAMSFPVYAYASNGAACGGSWDGDAEDIDFDVAEMRGIVKDEMKKCGELNGLIDVEMLFEGLETDEVDIETILNDAAYEAAYPEGAPSGYLKGYVPNELKSLADEIMSLDENDEDYEECAAAVREKLQGIQTGKYTVIADISYNGDYTFAEDEKVTVKLSAEMARGILYNYCDNDDISIDGLFDGIDYEETCEEDVQELVDRHDFSGYADNVTGECCALENYTHAWCQFIYAILTQKITEEQLDDCLDFFYEADFEEESESDFDNWMEEKKEEEA